MTTYGLTIDGFVKKPLTVILAEIEASLIAKFGEVNTDSEAVFGILAGIFSDREYQLWELTEEVYLAMYPNSAEGFSLDGVAQMTGIVRLVATQTLVTGALLGDEGTLVIGGKQASVSNTGEVFALTQDTEITKDVVIRSVSTPTDGLTGATYEVEIDGTTKSVVANVDVPNVPTLTEVVTEMIAKFGAITGITLTAINGGDSLVITSDDFETTFQFDVITNWGIDTIEAPGFFEAVNTGVVIALTGTLTVIETPVSGWTSVTNYEDGNVGRAVETDAELRLRRRESLSLIGAGTVEAIRAHLLQDVDDVVGVKINENRTDTTDGDGLPPHSFEAVISGGTDLDIAEKIWEIKPAGIETHGSTTQNITDSQGDTQAIKFSRPTTQYAYLRVTLTKYAEEEYPAGGDAQVAANLLAFGNTLDIGDDILVQRFLTPIFEVSGISSAVIEVDVLLSPGAPSYGTADIAIANDEIAIFDSGRITII